MNSVTLFGRLGKDPETTQVGETTICSFSLATNNGKDKQPTWHQIKAFAKTAAVIQQHFKQGDLILIQGRIDYREHDGKWYTNIIVDRFEFAGSPKQTPSDNEPDLPF